MFAKRRTTASTTSTTIRWGIRKDLPEILAIEDRCFEYPWDEQTFLQHMWHRDCVLLVADNAAGVMGYCLYYLHPTAIEIANVAVHPGYRHQGVGRKFMAQLLKTLRPPGKRRTAFSVVWERNLDGQLFFRACGFQCRKVIKNHWLDTGDDAYRFEFSPYAIAAGGGGGINQESNKCQGR